MNKIFNFILLILNIIFNFVLSKLHRFNFAEPDLPYSSEEINTFLFAEDDMTENKGNSEDLTDNFVCQQKVGTITRLEAKYGLIDDQFYFELNDLIARNVTCGQLVSYMAYRKNNTIEWTVKQINVIRNDELWVNDTDIGKDVKPLILSENKAIRRVIAAKVVRKEGRSITLNVENFVCSLDVIRSQFLPMEGDWVLINAVVRLNSEGAESYSKQSIVDVVSLEPSKSKNVEGIVTDLSQNKHDELIGIISREVYFTASCCEPGYRPLLDDKVIAKVIESEQGDLIWRAISVVAVDNIETSSLLSKIKVDERPFNSKNNVYVTSKCDKKALIIGETTKFKITIENCGNNTQILLGIDMKKSELDNGMKILTEIEYPVSITPSMCYDFTVEAVASCSGYFPDLLFLRFEGGWEIRHILHLYVDENQTSNKIRNCFAPEEERYLNTRSKYHMERMRKTFATRSGFWIPGQSPFRGSKFVPRHLPHFEIPVDIRNIVCGNGKLLKNIQDSLSKKYPVIFEMLKENNYCLKFHTLLHLENLEQNISIKKYDKERTCFQKRGEYLGLEMGNLAESRPSLIVGDRVVASDALLIGPNENVFRYEGYIHKVLANEIFLKFHKTFHDCYDGKCYSVNFIASRTYIRRCHQAIDVIVEPHHPGYSWLFPQSVGTLKPSQLNIIGEFPDMLPKIEEHMCPKKENYSEKSATSLSTARKSVLENLMDNLCDTDDESDCEINDNVKETNSDPVTFRKFSCKADDTVTETHDYATSHQEFENIIIKWEYDNQRRVSKRDNLNCSNSTETKLVCRDVILKWVNIKLNHYQREAVRNILRGEARPLPYVIFGPPGTGKTVTIVEIILQIAFLMPESRLLVTTPSNSSADLICERLLSWKLLKPGDLIRLVGYNYMIDDRMSYIVKPYCTVMDLTSTDKERSRSENGVKLSSREVIGRHKITVSTCSAVGILYSMGFSKSHFSHIIVDEAGQATEPEIMIPFAFLNTNGQAILAGDPLQLGPVITSRIAESMGLSDSFLSRLSMMFLYQRDPEGFPNTRGYNPLLVTRLLYNYRSLPNILNMYSTMFYDATLLPMVCDKCSDERNLIDQVRENIKYDPDQVVSEVIFHGVRGYNKQENDSPSWYNEAEYCKVFQYFVRLQNSGISGDDIGIVTPYQKQVIKIRELLKNSEIVIKQPKVGTVEEFQGQERKVIILSIVRSEERLLNYDKKFALGFVSNKQRINVAISRARALLIIIGNPHLLAFNPTWKNLIRMCLEKQNYYGCELPESLK